MVLGLSDDVVYAILLVVCIPLGHVLKQASPGAPRQWLATLTGVAILIIVCGNHSLHSFVTIAINCLIVTVINPRLLYTQIHYTKWLFLNKINLVSDNTKINQKMYRVGRASLAQLFKIKLD